jgi:hypothetical protein
LVGLEDEDENGRMDKILAVEPEKGMKSKIHEMRGR